MAEFINTVDAIGDNAVTDGIIERSIAEYKDDAVVTVGTRSFFQCKKLSKVVLPAATTIQDSAFMGCSSLALADFSAVTNIRAYSFNACSALTALILRKTETVASLQNSTVLTGTPINYGAGYIYVPRALVDSYKAATNWSTYANKFRALEDYTVDGTITGELDPSKI